MARTITEIHNELIAAKEAQPELAVLTSTSKAARWRLWLYVQAFCTWTLEKIYDRHLLEVKDIIDVMKPHSDRWYAFKVKLFRYGFNLLPESDQYSDVGLTADQILATQIVAQAAVTEEERGIRIKVAKLVSGDLGALSNPELVALQTYVARVKDAGVKVLTTTGPADSLKLKLFVKFNPLVLNANGQRLDGTANEPVQDAVNRYLKNLPFNNRLELVKLIDEIQAVEGVDAPYITEASARYGALPYTGFNNEVYVPDAGYLRLYSPTDLVINWLAN